MSEQAYIASNPTGPTEVVFIEEERCIGCNACANICRTQTLLPNPEKGKPPLLVYPDECWFCACCVEACPTGALEMRHPIGRRILFKRKDTGEVFRIGQKDAPAKSFFRPPYGELQDDGLAPVWIALNRKETKTAAILSDEVCAAVARRFGWQNCPGKLVSLMQYMGFDAVLHADYPLQLSDGSSDAFTVVSFTTEHTCAEPRADLQYTARDLAAMIRRACVSMYTAVHIWETLPESAFDTMPV